MTPAAAPPDQQTGAVTEIRDVSSSDIKPDIIWRRHTDAADYSGRNESSSPPAPPAALQGPDRIASQLQQQAPGDEIRVEQLSPQVIRTISERVIRAISLDLKVERERRGISKWR